MGELLHTDSYFNNQSINLADAIRSVGVLVALSATIPRVACQRPTAENRKQHRKGTQHKVNTCIMYGSKAVYQSGLD